MEETALSCAITLGNSLDFRRGPIVRFHYRISHHTIFKVKSIFFLKFTFLAMKEYKCSIILDKFKIGTTMNIPVLQILCLNNSLLRIILTVKVNSPLTGIALCIGLDRFLIKSYKAK